MAESDLQRFIDKVRQLQSLVDSLEHVPGRREQLAACHHHNQVVLLAASWGYDIGRRWGDSNQPSRSDSSSNLLDASLPPPGQESHRLIQAGQNWRLEVISSLAASSPEGFWYDQSEHEWLTLLRGSAGLRLRDPDEYLDLSVGDQLHLPAHRLHRVERTDPPPGTIWLAFFWTPSAGRT